VSLTVDSPSSDRLRDIRVAFGLTSQELARSLSVSISTMTRWEAGLTDPVGLAADVVAGLHAAALALPAEEALRLGRRLALGLGAFLHGELLRVAVSPI
jgi:transcriptional regulator with XRE-family HTH domain